MIEAVDNIVAEASREGRSVLQEHEVYAVLGLLGFSVPAHSLLTSSEEVTDTLLARFGGHKVVLKIVSPGVAHKEKAGGVEILYKDRDFIRFRFDRMMERFRNRDIEPAGILIVDMIDYSPALGNEILLGFRESPTFGPVLSFSKGGSDAEHFAAHFSPPNLVLPPLSAEWARALLSSTEIYRKYRDEGRGDFVETIAEAEQRFSQLAAAYSPSFPGQSRFVFTEFEINPFVFDREGRFLPLDGYAVFAERTPPSGRVPLPVESLDPFFKPRGIAIAGVSRRSREKSGNIIAANLVKNGRKDLAFVNAQGGEVEIAGKQETLYRAVDEIPDPIDLLIVTVPAEATLSVVKEGLAKGIKALLLIPGGFSESSRNDALENEILKLCREASVRVMGPNCLGIIAQGERKGGGINTFFLPDRKFHMEPRGRNNVVLLSQSGALGIVEIAALNNALSPRVIVSYGNQLDVGPTDLLGYFERDESVGVIGLYIEGFKPGAGRRFFDLASQSTVPVVVYKAGRTPAGRMATQSHTASMAGEYSVAQAALKQAGLVVARTMEEHSGYIKTFSLLQGCRVEGRRTVVAANAGYEKTSAADNLGELVLAELGTETLEALRRIIPPFVEADPLLDLTPMADDRCYVQAVDTLLGSDEVDALILSIVPQAALIHTTNDEIDGYPDNLAAGLVEVVQRHKKPVTASVPVALGGDRVYSRLIEVLEQGGIPVFQGAERASSFLNGFIRYRIIKERHLLSEWMR